MSFYLSGEADKLEGLILEPAAHDVGEGAVGVLVERGAVPRLRGAEGDVGEGDGERQDAVDEDEELGVLELPRVPGRVHVLE